MDIEPEMKTDTHTHTHTHTQGEMHRIIIIIQFKLTVNTGRLYLDYHPHQIVQICIYYYFFVIIIQSKG